MTHSPGPWSADLKHQCKIVGAWKSKNGGGCTVTLKTLEILDNNTIGTIAIVNCESSPPSKEDKANARLIAAAPDMLEALKSLASTSQIWAMLDTKIVPHIFFDLDQFLNPKLELLRLPQGISTHKFFLRVTEPNAYLQFFQVASLKKPIL
jgi:hypothetical protein